jgi:hypothetical protein
LFDFDQYPYPSVFNKPKISVLRRRDSRVTFTPELQISFFLNKLLALLGALTHVNLKPLSTILAPCLEQVFPALIDAMAGVVVVTMRRLNRKTPTRDWRSRNMN